MAVTTDRRFTVRRLGPEIVEVIVDASGPNFSWPLLICSDSHRDSPKCDRAMEDRHLQMVADAGGGVIHLGDIFDAMQGRNDKRRSHDELDPGIDQIMRKKKLPYSDALVAWMAGEYAPYASNIIAIGHGNHETAVCKFMDRDLSHDLVNCLRAAGSQAEKMPYRWYLRVVLRQTPEGANGLASNVVTIACFHGSGGSSPVTKGAIPLSRFCSMLEGVDMVVTGHLHNSLSIPTARYIPNKSGEVRIREIECAQVGGYKQDTKGGAGWATEKGMAPSTLGAVMVEFSWAQHRHGRRKSGKANYSRRPRLEVKRVK